MAAHPFEAIARSLFEAAMAEDRCGELLTFLWAGVGTASIDVDGRLVTDHASRLLVEVPADGDDQNDESSWCECADPVVEPIPLFAAVQCGRCKRPMPEADATPAHGIVRPVVVEG